MAIKPSDGEFQNILSIRLDRLSVKITLDLGAERLCISVSVPWMPGHGFGANCLQSLWNTSIGGKLQITWSSTVINRRRRHIGEEVIQNRTESIDIRRPVNAFEISESLFRRHV